MHFYFLIYLWLCWVFVAVLGLFSSCCEQGLLSDCGPQVSCSSGFSCCRAWALGNQASVASMRELSSCSSQALECWLSSCVEWAWLLHSMWDLPGQEIEPMSPALAGRFFTSEPPGKHVHVFFK